MSNFAYLDSFTPKIEAENGVRNGTKNHVVQYFSDLAHQIFLIFCMQLEVNNGYILVKTACPGKIWFSQNFGKSAEKR